MTTKSSVEYKPIAWVSEIQLCVRSMAFSSMACPSLLLGGSPAGPNLPDHDGQVLGAGLNCSESSRRGGRVGKRGQIVSNGGCVARYHLSEDRIRHLYER